MTVHTPHAPKGRSAFRDRIFWKLAVLGVVLLAASGCVRLRRGWLINVNLSLEWNRIPWRTGPDGHYEVDPPDCVACGHHGPRGRCPRCVAAGPGVPQAEQVPPEKLPALEPPGRLQAVPVQRPGADAPEQEEEVPPPVLPQQKSASPPRSPVAAPPVEENEPRPENQTRGGAPQANSWYGRRLSRSWVFRPSQSYGSTTRRMVRIDQHGRRVR